MVGKGESKKQGKAKMRCEKGKGSKIKVAEVKEGSEIVIDRKRGQVEGDLSYKEIDEG